MMQVLMATSTYILVRCCCSLKLRRWTLICPIGYYVHTCQKMKYKGEYSPSHLLDPVRLTAPPLSLLIDGM